MEELRLVVTAIVVLLVLTLFYVYLNSSRKYPPGPYGVPLLGYLPFMGKRMHLTFTSLSKKYGNVMSVRLGPQTVVVLNDFEAIRQALVVQKDTFSGRANKIQFQEIRGTDVAASDGPLWKEEKRFVMRKLKELGGAGGACNESDVIYEVEKLTECLKRKSGGQAVEITELMFLPILNIICKLSFGKRYETEDCEDVRRLKEAFNAMQLPQSVIKFLPFMRNLANSPFRQGIKQILSFLKREVDCRETDSTANSQKDFTDLYLDEIRRSEQNNGTAIAPFIRSHLLGTLLDLLIAGTLLWSLLYMAHHPEVQKRVQQELDDLMTKDSVLLADSKTQAPFTRATIMEVMRISSVLPLALPHRTVKDSVLLGHKIPKDCILFINLFAVHHSERHWGDPSVFRPSRFLDDDGQVALNDHLIPFSIGSRVCVGEQIAKRTLFLFFTCLLRRFEFTLAERQPKPSLEVGNNGITSRPQPFSLVVMCRD